MSPARTTVERHDDAFDFEEYQREARNREKAERLRERVHHARDQRIPRLEQDEDLWRFASPGRDPVTDERGPKVSRR